MAGKKKRINAFAFSAKSCYVMPMQDWTIVRSEGIKVRANSVPYTAISLSCVNGCGK